MSSTPTKTAATYRKTRDGQWVVMAPANHLAAGSTITVTKKDGSAKTETIESVGKPFNANGTMMAYGYIAPKNAIARQTARRAARRFYAEGRCQCGTPIEGWMDGAGMGLCHDCF